MGVPGHGIPVHRSGDGPLAENPSEVVLRSTSRPGGVQRVKEITHLVKYTHAPVLWWNIYSMLKGGGFAQGFLLQYLTNKFGRIFPVFVSLPCNVRIRHSLTAL